MTSFSFRRIIRIVWSERIFKNTSLIKYSKVDIRIKYGQALGLYPSKHGDPAKDTVQKNKEDFKN